MKTAVCRAPTALVCTLGSGTLLVPPSLRTATLGNHNTTQPGLPGFGEGKPDGRGNSLWPRSYPGLRVEGGEWAGGAERVLEAVVVCKRYAYREIRGHIFSMHLTTLAALPNESLVNGACIKPLSLNLLSAGG